MANAQSTAYSISWAPSISDIDRDEWDALAKPLPTPFLEWDWLRLMELSGSTTAQTGWLPHHLTVRHGSNLVAAAPMYIKGHSAGEFVFDHMWADVAGRMGIQYYPKIVGMSPFTPMIGYRFLFAPGEDLPYLTAAMVAEIERLCRRYNLSGSSFHFVDPQWQREMLDLGRRVGDRQRMEHPGWLLAVPSQRIEEGCFVTLVNPLQRAQMHLAIVLLQIEQAAEITAGFSDDVFHRGVGDHEDVQLRSQGFQHTAKM